MRRPETGAVWKIGTAVLGVALILGLSLDALARPAASGRQPEHGSCCSNVIETYCPPCLGVWVCAEPDKRSTCSCVCGAVAEQYGCPWTIVWCE